MSTKGQTHAKRAREFALKEKRERKKAKKEAQRSGIDVADGDERSVPAQPEPAEWVQ